MTALALPHGFAQRLSTLWRIRPPTFATPLKTFSTSLTLVGEDTPAMIALRRIPYPSVPLDTSLFEEWSEDYAAADLLAHTSIESKPLAQESHPSLALEQLVEAQSYADAEEVRAELVQAGVNIRPHPAYYYAALWVLQNHAPDGRDVAFANWWSLLPPAHAPDARTMFLGVRRALFFRADLDLETIMRFALISASKGYARKVGPWVIGHIARFAKPAQTAQFLEDFLVEANGYAQSVPETGQRKESEKRWWSLAVRTHCITGRPEAAFDLLKKGLERGVSIRTFTYRFLLGLLQNRGDSVRAAELEKLFGGVGLTVAKAIFPASFPELKPLPPISGRNSVSVNTSIVLKHLIRQLKGLESARATDIVPFFQLYKDDHRGGLPIMQLRSRAYRLSITSLSTVMLAELLHHFHQGEYRHLLYVFYNMFYVTGVPKREVKMRLYTREDYPEEDRLHSKNLPARIKRTTFNLPEKLWPTSYHTSLVWGSLVRLAGISREVEWLYLKLIRHTNPGQRRAWALGVTPAKRHDPGYDASLEIGASPIQAYDATHFQWFFHAPTPDAFQPDPHRAMAILHDMEVRGIQPSLHNLATVAGIQAKHGDPQLALKLLERIDEMCLQNGTVESWFDREIAQEDAEEYDLEEDEEDAYSQNPTRLIAYTAVFRGFIDRQLLEHAQSIGAKIEDELQYIPGANARTDDALTWLGALEEAMDPETGVRLRAGLKHDLSQYLEPKVNPSASETIPLSRGTPRRR